MPIYEYQALEIKKACRNCRHPFECLQSLEDPPLDNCPECGEKVKRVMSWCRAAVVEADQEYTRVEKKISEYEKAGMWSHAAELGDKHSEKTGDSSSKWRALDNYKKAGYNPGTLEKYTKK